MHPIGPSRHSSRAQQVGRFSNRPFEVTSWGRADYPIFRGRADIERRRKPAESVDNDPTATLAAKFDVLQSALFPITVW